MANEFTPITTQEELNSVIGDRLNRQKESIEAKYSDYDEVKSTNKTLQAEIEKLKDETSEKIKSFDDIKNELDSLKLERMKHDVARKNGIPFEMATRLSGNNEKELEEDAKTMASFFTKSKSQAPLKTYENKQVDEKTTAYKKLLKDLKGE